MRKLSAILLLFCFSVLVNAQAFDPILAGQLQNTLDSMRTANNLKGISACVIYPGAGTWKGVSGISHPGNPINSDMEFGIASNTKLFTGVLLLKLADNNIIRLDDSLYSYLPAYNNIDSNITIRQLLHHTSGLYDVTSVPGYPDSMLTDPNRIYTAAELMTWADTPLFAPGTGWNYCNTNYLLAGMIAESATGQSYDRLLHDSILTPLQLDSTFLDVYDTIAVTKAHPWQAGVDNSGIPRTSVNSAAWSAGAMYSTAGEMAHWYHTLMSGQVLSPQSFHEMTTFVGSGDYGVGISRAVVNGRTVWQHGGAIWGGYNSFMLYDTATGIVISVLINQLPGQAFQVAIQLLSTITDYQLSVPEITSAASMINVWPNPADDMVRIDFPEKKLDRISVFDVTGQLVIESLEREFSVVGLKPGIYHLKISGDKGSYSCKMVKL